VPKRAMSLASSVRMGVGCDNSDRAIREPVTAIRSSFNALENASSTD
jgi:hypothetical protein